MAPDVGARGRLHDVLRIFLRDVAAEGLLERHAEAARQAREDAAARLTLVRRRVRAHRRRGRRRLRLLARLVAHRRSSADAGTFANSGQITDQSSKTPATIPTQTISVLRLYTSGITTTAPVASTQTRPNGISTFQPKLIRRSYRNRGIVARIQM